MRLFVFSRFPVSKRVSLFSSESIPPDPVLSFLRASLSYVQVLGRHEGAKTLLDVMDMGLADQVRVL